MLIIEFTHDRIKLVEAAAKGQKLTLTNISKRPIADLSDDEVAGAVVALLAESRIRKTQRLILSIPRHLFTVRNLKLPAVDETELREMAGLQAGKQLPYPADELIWDFKVIEKKPDGYSEIALILGHRKVLDRYLNILKKAGLEADRVILSSEALYAWYMAAAGLKDEALKGQIRSIVDIDASHMDIIVIRDGIMEFSRSFPVKNDQQEMLEETRKTFYSYEKDNSRVIMSIVLTGIEERANTLKSFLSGMEGIAKPAEFLHPLRAVSADYQNDLPSYIDACRDASFACALGIARDPDVLKMEFLPPELKEEKRLRERKGMFIRSAILAGAIVLALLGLFVKGFMYRTGEFNLLNAKIKETEPKVKRLKEISQQINIVKGGLDMRDSCVDVLREVFNIVPQDVSISVLDFELQKLLTLRGISTSMNSVFKFASDLKKSKYFKDCEIKYAQKRIIKERELVDYEINCTFSNRALK